jgi:hypothetical protein
MTGNKNKESISLVGSGVSVRNNCSGAFWSIGGERRLAGDIEIAIIALDEFTGALNSAENVYDWTKIWFVGAPKEEQLPKNIICHTLIKTQSKKNFDIAYALNYNNEPERLIWCPKFISKTGTDSNGKPTKYYCLDWTVRTRTKDEEGQLKQIKEFIESEVELIDHFCPVVKILNYVEPKALPSVEIPEALKTVVNI